MTVISHLVLYMTENQKKTRFRMQPHSTGAGCYKPEFFHHVTLQAKTTNNSFINRKAHKFSKLSLTQVSFHITDQCNEFTYRNIAE